MFPNPRSRATSLPSFPDTCTRPLFLDLEQTSLLFRRAGPSVLRDVCPVPCSRIGRAYLSSRCLLSLVRRIVGSRCCIAGQFEHAGKTNEKESERGREGKGDIDARGPRRGRNSRTSFLNVSRHPAGKNPDACLTTTRGKKRREGKTRKGKKGKPLKCTVQRLHFSRHLYGRLTLAIR